MTANWPDIAFNNKLKLLEAGPGIFLIEDFLPKESLHAWNEFITSLAGQMIYPTGPTAPGNAYRKNGRIQFIDESFAEKLWLESGLKKVIEGSKALVNVKRKKAVGVNQNFRIYSYLPGDSFGKHYDESITSDNGDTSEWTILLYLGHEACVGGATRFHFRDSIVDVEAKPNRMLLHRHGDTCTAHEGMKVREGVKWVLRTDLMYR